MSPPSEPPASESALPGVPAREASLSLGTRVLQNVVALLGGRAASLALSAVSSIVLVRHLGSEQIGRYGALYSYALLFAWLATFGLEPILAREASRRKQEQGDILATGVWLGTRFSVVAMLLAVALAPVLGYTGVLQGLLVLATAELLLLVPLRLPGLMFQVELQQWYTVGIGLLRQLAWLMVVGALAWAGASLPLLMAGRLACALGESLLIWRFSRPLLPSGGRVLFGEVKSILLQSLPVAFGVLAVSIYQRIDQVMLQKMVGGRELGHYVAAVNLVEPLQTLPFALLASLFPVLAQAVGEPDRFRLYFNLALRLLAVTSFGACVVLATAAEPLLGLLYGAEFRASAPLLTILVWAQPVVFLATAVANANMVRSHPSYNLLATAVGAATNVGLNLLLIPRWGAAGAAWATLCSCLLGWVVTLLVPVTTRPLVLSALRIFLPGGVLALAAVGSAIFLRLSPPLAVPLSLAVYGLGLWTLGIVRAEDVRWAARMIRRMLGRQEAAA